MFSSRFSCSSCKAKSIMLLLIRSLAVLLVSFMRPCSIWMFVKCASEERWSKYPDMCVCVCLCVCVCFVFALLFILLICYLASDSDSKIARSLKDIEYDIITRTCTTFCKAGEARTGAGEPQTRCGSPISAHPSTKGHTNSVSNTSRKKPKHSTKPFILTSPKMTHPALTDDRSRPTTKSS
ncbi:uncharacterized protein DI49_2124 [Saccharomyces eubayanus]|uniref:uncharacterized protein n=1 Tax=Saccharomyces eubayanus TaxID=1080349 RepID=UPI0006C48693|nr:hypothetical protein DI49_2124 [Saccharomyces eubayanus]KOG99649.1 hypothetical protein DI49_2124 [Saccharomyces eubayanus]